MTWIKAALMSFCQWSNETSFGHGIRDSVWLFPFVEIFHLLALGVLGGTVLIVNARLLGLRFADEPVSELERDVRPWMLGSLAVMLISGYLLFSTEAMKMYGNFGFRYKMLFLFLAIVFTFTIHRKVATSDEGKIAPVWRKLTAIVSLLLWIGVGLGGRSIGYIN